MTALLTIAEAARKLSVSEKTVRREIEDRKIGIVRVRGAIRISDNDLDDYVSRLKVRSTR